MGSDALLSSGSPEAILAVLSWLSTYVLHSTILLGSVWLATRLAPQLPDELQETLWRVALLGGLLTTTWQVACGTEPLAGTVRFENQIAASPSASLPPESIPSDQLASEATPLFGSEFGPLGPRSPRPDAAPAIAPSQVSWFTIGVMTYAGIALLALLHLLIARYRFRREFSDRRLITGGEMPLQLLRLVERAGFPRAVRLTSSDKLTTPIAFGSNQPEICVPTRAIHGLTDDEQESMLAHELAHLIHSDPAWLLACQVLQRLLLVQPLHLLARLHLQRLAEYRCDDWATRHSQNGISLARCLVEVAHWVSPAQPKLAHASGMAAGRSLLRQRVGRILDQPSQKRRPRLAAAAGLSVLAVSATALPGAAWTNPAATPSFAELLTPLPEITPLPVGPAILALNSEIDELETELAYLRDGLEGIDTDPEIIALTSKVELYLLDLRQRRDQMQAMLPATLDALRAGESRNAGGVFPNPGDQK